MVLEVMISVAARLSLTLFRMAACLGDIDDLKAVTQFTLKRVLVCIAVLATVFAFVFTSRFYAVCSSLTQTPTSWVRSSSPMKKHLGFIFTNVDDPKLVDSDAVKQLRNIIGDELSRQSTTAEIEDHIRRHYQHPSFVRSGMCAADIWRQDAYGYYTVWYPGRAMLHVNYYSGDGHFLFADITHDGLRQTIILSEPVDVYNSKTW